MKARLALIWAAIVAAGVTVVGVLTGRRRKRRAQRQQARDQRRAKKAQRRAQGGGRRPSGTASAPAAAASPAKASTEPESGAATPSDADGDDLRAIKGLGAVAAEKLRGAGVTTYAQIAAWTPEEARDLALRLDLQPGRIASDDWVGQARALVEARDGETAQA